MHFALISARERENALCTRDVYAILGGVAQIALPKYVATETAVVMFLVLAFVTEDGLVLIVALQFLVRILSVVVTVCVIGGVVSVPGDGPDLHATSHPQNVQPAHLAPSATE